MDWILDRLALGDFEDGKAAALPVTTILNLAEQGYVSAIPCLHCPIPDESFLPYWCWSSLISALERLLHARETVLVHCRLGVSRSPALVAAYLVECGMSSASALTYVQGKRSRVQIHPETWRGITTMWGEGARHVHTS